MTIREVNALGGPLVGYKTFKMAEKKLNKIKEIFSDFDDRELMVRALSDGTFIPYVIPSEKHGHVALNVIHSGKFPRVMILRN